MTTGRAQRDSEIAREPSVRETPEQATVCAVIVTFNRRDTVQTCLEAVWNQTRVPETVLVVDNASTDGTAEFLSDLVTRQPDVRMVRLSGNLGPAGGFEAGIDWAARQGFTYLWLMDDDCIPQPDCLEHLLADAGTNQDKLVIPKNTDNSKHPSLHAPGWWGVLLSRKIVETVGLPNPDLFWWIEDTEYLRWRVQIKHGFQRINSDSAEVRHGGDKPRNKPAWKYYYEVRNKVYYRTWVWRRRKLVVARDVAKMWVRVLLLEDTKLKKSRFIMLGIYHGVIGRIGKTFDPASC